MLLLASLQVDLDDMVNDNLNNVEVDNDAGIIDKLWNDARPKA